METHVAEDSQDVAKPLTELRFPPVTRAHILHCSYHYWHPRYLKFTPKARLVPLNSQFIDYLKSDGIILPPDDEPAAASDTWDDHDSGIFSGTDADNDHDEEETANPSIAWLELHESIQRTIRELGGKVAPKLNWSAPKDATWINPTNSMECRSANDVYMMLKSSDFINFDLDQVFEDTEADGDDADVARDYGVDPARGIPYHLILRKYVNFNPSVEFRCFVRRRRIVGICQRDLNHFDFLSTMVDDLRDLIEDFFDDELRTTFPDDNFVFDVYIPAPHAKVWLIDINPWAPRTDPILYSWLELLTMPDQGEDQSAEENLEAGVIRLQLGSGSASHADNPSVEQAMDDSEAIIAFPEFRLIKKDDPEARNFNSQQYSAHKMPKDVVDAGQAGPGVMRQFADQWKEAMAKQSQSGEDSDADE